MAQYNYDPKGERVSKIAAEVATYDYWVVGDKVSGLRRLDNDERNKLDLHEASFEASKSFQEELRKHCKLQSCEAFGTVDLDAHHRVGSGRVAVMCRGGHGPDRPQGAP